MMPIPRQRHALQNLCALVIASAALLPGCHRDAPVADDEPIVARIGDDVITVADFEQEMRDRSRHRPGRFAEAESREELLDELIRWRALVAEAQARGIDREPEMRRMIERLLVQRLRDEHVSQELQQIVISDDEVAAFYTAHEHEFARPARVQGAIVFIAASNDPAERATARERIDSALAATRALPDETLHFGAVATEYSEDRASRYQGGVIGWLIDRPERGYRWDAAVVDALFALDAPGDLAPVIETDEGFYLVRLVTRESARGLPLAQVADGIRHRMLRERRAALEQEIHDALTARWAVEIDRDRLRAVQPPSSVEVMVEPETDPPRPPALPGDMADLYPIDSADDRENDA